MSAKRSCVGLAALGVALSVGSPSATADVTGVGWWTRSPAAQAPENGIAVGAAPDGPTSVAAVLVDLGDGASSALVEIHQSGGAAPAGANLEACIVSSFTPAAGAPIEEAPTTTCEGASVPFVLGQDAATWSADLSALVADATGSVGVAIVPVPGAGLFDLQFDTASAQVRPAATPSRTTSGSGSGSTTATTMARPTTSPTPYSPPATSSFRPPSAPPVGAATSTTIAHEGSTATTTASSEVAAGGSIFQPTAASTGDDTSSGGSGQTLGYILTAAVIGIIGGVAHKLASRRFAL